MKKTDIIVAKQDITCFIKKNVSNEKWNPYLTGYDSAIVKQGDLLVILECHCKSKDIAGMYGFGISHRNLLFCYHPEHGALFVYKHKDFVVPLEQAWRIQLAKKSSKKCAKNNKQKA